MTLAIFAGQVEEAEVVDSKILSYCSLDKKGKKSLGEMEQEFLQALQVWKHNSASINMFSLQCRYLTHLPLLPMNST